MKKLTIADIILIILFLFAIGLALWYFLGKSPTLEQVIITFLLTVVFTLAINVSRNGMKMDYMEKNLTNLKIDIKDSFNRIKGDMNLIKNKLKI